MYQHRHVLIKTVNEMQIPKIMIAQAADTNPKRVTDFMKCRAVRTEIENKITEAIKAIACVWTAFSPFKVTLDSPELLEAGLQIAQEIEMTRELQKAQLEISQALPAL